MVIVTRFSKKLKLPSTAQIKHQLLLRWLADQTAKEENEANKPPDAASTRGPAP